MLYSVSTLYLKSGKKCSCVQVKGGNQLKDREKYERRLVDELHRVFTDTDSFYFCVDKDGRPEDLTNTLQRHCELEPAAPRWRNADKRFFWNKHMLKEILLLNVSSVKIFPTKKVLIKLYQKTY